jgi:NAD(P)-dependent dehydrogenase (short-subunit alcohol dehydrogenase family)
MRGLHDKKILIAGGATGIGAATALRLAEEGAVVIIGDLYEDSAAATAARIQAQTGSTVRSTGFDATDPGSAATLVANAQEQLDGLDGVHYNVANLSHAVFGNDSDVVDIDLQVWNATLAAGLNGLLYVLKAAVPALLERPGGGGAIVATSSDASFEGRDSKPAYGVAKAGVNILIQHVARKWGKAGLRANAVAPSFTLTEVALAEDRPGWQEAMLANVPSTRVGDPGDTAAMVAYLFSDDAAWINGQVVGVNGGMYLR